MMLRIRKYGLLLVLLVFAGLTGTACKPSAEQLNQEGNDRFAEEAFLEALQAYQSAQIESPELAEPYYNAANALYREGAFDEALAQLEQALQFARLDEDSAQSLAERGFYNLGNTSYNQESWEAAVAAYREALLRNPDDLDAKYNLELALQQLQQQQQEQEQQDQQQEEQQQDQDQQNEDQQNQDQQDQSENSEGQQNEQQESQDQSQQGENDQQEGDEEKSDDNSGNEGEQEQDQQNQSQSGQEQAEGGTSPSTVPPSGQGMTAEQAEQLLAAIAAESDTLQERLGQIFTVPFLPPVQDW